MRFASMTMVGLPSSGPATPTRTRSTRSGLEDGSMPSKTETLGQAMAAVSRGDVDLFGDILLSDDVVWHWPGASSVSGDYRGRAAALDLIRGFHRLTGGRLKVEPVDVLEGGEHLMSFTHITADKDGMHLDVMM